LRHNGVEIDQFVLLTIYPAVSIFVIAFIGNKLNLKKSVQYLIQARVCVVFAVIYSLFIPNGGAQGLAIVLFLFSFILLLMARKQKIEPEENDKSKAFKENSL
jgi:hypothetical protein